MNGTEIRKGAKNFALTFCLTVSLVLSALCCVPSAQASDDTKLQTLQELKALREEIAGLRQDLRTIARALFGQDIFASPTAVSPEATKQNEASRDTSNIVSNLRNLKAASLMFYADSMDVVNSPDFVMPADIVENTLVRYVDNPAEFQSGQYQLIMKGNRWFVGYDVSQESPEVRAKLAEKAKSTGLFGEPDPAQNASPYTEEKSIVWMIAR